MIANVHRRQNVFGIPAICTSSESLTLLTVEFYIQISLSNSFLPLNKFPL